MKDIKVKDIIKVCDGKLICGDEEYVCENFSKDTRQISDGDVFVGIKGENFDGNSLYKEAIENGAKVCILQNVDIDAEFVNKNTASIIIVENIVKAIGKIANYKRNLYGKEFPVIAVTGSVGKTSTKDIIASVVSEKYNALKTEGNLNSQIGLPFTILKLKDHNALVVEMGMNQFGEIENLTKIAEPNIAVITNIGTSHIGNLGSRENILKAKLEILKSKNIKHLVINNDNDLLHKYYIENNSIDNKNALISKDVGVDVSVDPIKIHTFGIKNESDSMANNINLNEESSQFDCVYNETSANIFVPVGGEHFIYNALCAYTVGKILNINDEKIVEGIKKFELTKKRMEIVKIRDNITVINDSYNASYDSMKAAIEYLASIKIGRKIAVLGDMLELGEYSKELHEKVGEEINKNDIDILITVGENAKYIAEIVKKQNKDVYSFNNNRTAVEFLNNSIKSGDVLLLKASNGMNFSEILEGIR